MEVVALSAIPEASEISISYIDPSSDSTSAQRRQELSAWHFACECSICSTSPSSPYSSYSSSSGSSREKVLRSDARRRRMKELKHRLNDARGSAVRILKESLGLIDLFEKEGMVLPQGEYYALAAMAATHLGDREKAVELVGELRRLWGIVHGEERAGSMMAELQLELDSIGG